MAEMKEILIDDNNTGLKVFINGDPDLSLVSENLMECFISAITEQIMILSKKDDD